MSEPSDVSEPSDREAPPEENAAVLRLATGPLAGPVLCRVVSMMLARAHCPMDRLDDAMLICDAIAAHAPAYASDGYLALTVSPSPGGVELRVGELAERGARGLLADAAVPGVGNVLERVTDELRVEASQSDGHSEELVLRLAFGS